MEPHVFARFKKVELHIDACFRGGPALLISQDFKIAKEARFTRLLTHSSLMKSAAKLLSNSPFVRDLSICLNTDVHPEGHDTVAFYDPIPTVEECCDLFAAAEKRAIEIVVDSKLLMPLFALRKCPVFRICIQENLFQQRTRAVRDVRQ